MKKILRNLKKKNLNNNIMVIGQSKNEENNSMEDIKNLRVDEKTRADTLIINLFKECVTRIEKLENQNRTNYSINDLR